MRLLVCLYHGRERSQSGGGASYGLRDAVGRIGFRIPAGDGDPQVRVDKRGRHHVARTDLTDRNRDRIFGAHPLSSGLKARLVDAPAGVDPLLFILQVLCDIFGGGDLHAGIRLPQCDGQGIDDRSALFGRKVLRV